MKKSQKKIILIIFLTILIVGLGSFLFVKLEMPRRIAVFLPTEYTVHRDMNKYLIDTDSIFKELEIQYDSGSTSGNGFGDTSEGDSKEDSEGGSRVINGYNDAIGVAPVEVQR